MITQKVLAEFAKRLSDEKERLEVEFRKYGKVVGELPNGQTDWAVTPSEPDDSEQDFTVMADRIEEFENQQSRFAILEVQYRDVCEALLRIENKTFGKCEVDGKGIEIERLQANPAARTCKKHM